MLTDNLRHQLIQAACEARLRAYAPYSNYLVGAALLAESGKIYSGGNIENAAFPVTVCAERVAVFKAVDAGERRFTAIAVATSNGGFPCGSCRQVLAEFGLNTQVLVVDETGRMVHQGSVEQLLPGAFTPVDLVKGDSSLG